MTEKEEAPRAGISNTEGLRAAWRTLRWLVGLLWLGLSVAAYYYLWSQFKGDGSDDADWIRASGFFIAAFGAGPLGLFLADERSKLLATQTENDSLRRVTESFTTAVGMLGHEETAVRQGGIHALERIAQENPAEQPKIVGVMAAYIRDGSVRYVDEIISTFLKAQGELPDAEAILRRDLLIEKARTPKRGGIPNPVGHLASRMEKGQKVEILDLHVVILPFLPMPVDLTAAVDVIRTRAATDLTGTRLSLSSARLYRVNLSGASLRGADLSDSYAHQCAFPGADLSGAFLTRASLLGTDFRGAHMQSANLDDADLQGAVFDGANLRSARLHGAKMVGVRLVRVDLRQADLAHAFPMRANLNEADLRGADLQCTDFGDAHLRGAKLQGTNLQGAILDGAYLHGADLRGAKNLKQERLEKTVGDKSTRLPKGLERPKLWEELEGHNAIPEGEPLSMHLSARGREEDERE